MCKESTLSAGLFAVMYGWVHILFQASLSRSQSFQRRVAALLAVLLWQPFTILTHSIVHAAIDSVDET